jgi:secreted trypsin-like serine protease
MQLSAAVRPWSAALVIVLLWVFVAPSSPASLPQWKPQLLSLSSSLRAPQVGIYNGTVAADGQFPWAVALLDGGREQFCAGSLVNPSAVLTAAHCVLGTDRSTLQLVMNATDYADASAGSTRVVRKASSFHAHPGFNESSNTPDFDVAVIILDTPVPGGASGGAAGVPILAMVDNTTASLESSGTSVTALGWGQMSSHYSDVAGGGSEGGGRARDTEDSTAVQRLHYANLTVIDLPRCQELFPTPHWCCPWPELSPNMMCSYDLSGRNASTCNGDSGGPLVAWQQQGSGASSSSSSSSSSKPVPVQVGIVSWGTLCGGPPDVYQRVLRWRDWIDGVLREHTHA